MENQGMLTKHPDVSAYPGERALKLKHKCGGTLDNRGDGIYCCRSEQGGCGQVFKREEIFPIPT